jgi:glycosyltransferase involved in cell wall biosynthesis
LWSCSREIRRRRIDIVHTFMAKSTLFGVVAGRCGGCRAVLSSRRNLGYWYSPLYVRLFRLLNRLTIRIVANSEGAKAATIQIEKVRDGLVDVIYNGVDVDRFSAPRNEALARSLGIPARSSVVGILANYRSVKDLPLFLRAARIIAARHPEAVFLLVGAGPERDELSRMAAEWGLTEKVLFTDGKGDVAHYLGLMDVACLSSLTEGFSNAILEYMAAGLPVVATDVGGNREAVEHGVSGFILTSREASEFADYIDKLLSSEELRRTMGANARRRCVATFSIDSHMQRLQAYYEGLNLRSR